MQSRFPARKANPVDPIPQGTETDENILERNGSILLGTEDKGVVVAIRTAEITMGKEDHRADLTPPIRKGGFQESFDLDHGFESKK